MRAGILTTRGDRGRTRGRENSRASRRGIGWDDFNADPGRLVLLDEARTIPTGCDDIVGAGLAATDCNLVVAAATGGAIGCLNFGLTNGFTSTILFPRTSVRKLAHSLSQKSFARFAERYSLASADREIVHGNSSRNFLKAILTRWLHKSRKFGTLVIDHDFKNTIDTLVWSTLFFFLWKLIFEARDSEEAC